MPRTQDVVNTIATTDVPSTLQKRYAYDVNNLVEYAASAPRGASESDLVWTITKFFYNESNLVTKSLTAFDSWDNYLTADYA